MTIRFFRDATSATPRDAEGVIEKQLVQLRQRFPDRFPSPTSQGPEPVQKPFRNQIEDLVRLGKVTRQNLEKVVRFSKTKYVIHRSWGIGKIVSIHTTEARIVVDFESEPSRSIDLNFAAQILKPVADPESVKIFLPQNIKKLNWKFLGKGDIEISRIMSYINTLPKIRGPRNFDTSRIQFILDQKPQEIFAGLDEFEGYLAFTFPRVERTVMENPHEGNAIYVFGRNWKDLSKLSKSELMHSNLTFDRVTHSGGWRLRLLKTLVRA